ncbi:hypothetical protein Pint_15217 [Pistacia integerrima]|uniref:Uncharacterized protein n=1 Tax=Pistacia integerrima TaxID=434235 RepID=A0ACC0ZD44_9ROSI|nr:hypothetical protein Pint_15217 [Pistacia integerrima]
MTLSQSLQLLFVVSVVVLLLAHRLHQWLRYKLPPGPYPWPIIGNIYHVKPDRLRSYTEWSKIYGPIISVWVGSTLNVVVSNSELAKEVLKDNDQQLANRHRTMAGAVLSKNGKDLIWADYGPHYVKVRKLCNLELFSPKSVEALRPIREDEVRAMIKSIFKDFCNTHPDNRGEGLVLRKYLGSVAFNVITRLVFGKSFVSKEGIMDNQGLEFQAILAAEFKLGGALMGMVEHIGWLKWILWFYNNKALSKHLARKERLVRDIMDEHKAKSTKSGSRKQHFVDALLSLEEKYDLGEDTIIGLLWNMITAGMDTIAITVEWAMAELIKNPRVQHKAQEELERFTWTPPEAIMPEEIDMSMMPGLVTYMGTPLKAVPSMRLPTYLYE